MFHVVHIDRDGGRRSLEISELAQLPPADGGWNWIDVVDPSDDELRTVARHFDLDRVTRDDLFEAQAPKFELLEGHWLLVLHGLAADATALRTVECDVVVGPDWIVTSHRAPLVTIDHVKERIVRPAFAVDDPGHLAVRLAEFVGERYLPILDELDAQILDLEDEAVEGDPTVVPDIHALRRDVALLRRVLGPQRRVLEVLQRKDLSLTDRTMRDLSDALDHHNRLSDSLESAHQMVVTVLDTYRGAAADKTNEVMTVLTVVSAIFLPLTLIAGIYGMNFTYMPELQRRWGYFACLGAMAALGIGMWLYFMHRGLIGGPRIRDLAAPARAAGRVGKGLASAAILPLAVTTKAAKATARIVTSSEPDRPS